jgi:SulP family sulfate permease
VAAGAEPPEAASPPGSPFRPERTEPLLRRSVPVAGAIASYRVSTARRDAVAGVTVAALAIPSAMAYAELAGAPPVHGLYALLLPMVAYFVLGSSRQLIVGPEGSVSVLVAAAVLPLAVAGSTHAAALAATVALMVGVCFALARLVGLGWVGDYLVVIAAIPLYVRGRVHEAIRGAPDAVGWLVLDAEAVTHADSTGLETVAQLADELERGGVRLAVARLRTRMLEHFEAAGLVHRIGPARFYPSVRAAVDGCLKELSREREEEHVPAGGARR